MNNSLQNRPLKVAFYRRNFSGPDGGAYSFQKTVIEELISKSLSFEPIIISEPGLSPLEGFNGIEFTYHTPQKRCLLGALRRRTQNLDELLLQNKVSLLWLLGSFQPTSLPFVVTLFDLQHRVHPMFPEVSKYGWNWAQREEYYANNLARASFVVCGTEHGRSEAIHHYRLDPQRVKVIPFPVTLPPGPTATLENTPRPYLLYPAQFWPHKNHVILIQALHSLHMQGLMNIDLVLCGAKKENFSYIQSLVSEFGLQERVKFLDFVDTDTLRSLYSNAFATVYPSFFGPDNLPTIEAMSCSCPVIAADIPGAREQLQDAALYFDPKTCLSLIQAIVQLDQNQQKRKDMILKGLALTNSLNASNYVKSICKLVQELDVYFRCWDQSRPADYRW